jgi:DNA-binding transcriptional LysR family regulator
VELRHLRYFIALAEELHFGRAAQRLHIVQPALSRQVMALERELGVELLDRSHGVTLTRAGETFYEEARAIVEQADTAVATTRATARGELGSITIGFVQPAMWNVLPPILRAHRRAYPNLTYRLYELGSPDQFERLRARTLDIGFVRPLVIDDVLTFEPFWREHFVLALADDHPLAAHEAIDLAHLKDERFVVLPRPLAPGLNDIHLSICLSYGFTPKVVEQGNSPSALVMVSMGMCVALIPESVENARFQGITYRPLIRPTPEIDLAAVYRTDNHSRILQAFLETARRVVPGVQAPGRPPYAAVPVSTTGTGPSR